MNYVINLCANCAFYGTCTNTSQWCACYTPKLMDEDRSK